MVENRTHNTAHELTAIGATALTYDARAEGSTPKVIIEDETEEEITMVGQAIEPKAPHDTPRGTKRFFNIKFDG